jgi:HK97 family phage major capsid protein
VSDTLDKAPPARLPFPVTRARADPSEIKADDSGRTMMTGRFATIGDWYEVNSRLEGHFLERVAAGAFDRTVTESRANMRVLYDHGQDPTMGNQVLGSIDDLTSDARFRVGLFDGIPPLLLSGLRAGVYGSSHRFSVMKDGDTWDHSPKRSTHNPEGLPERTITEAKVYEFGPVTFPANPNATASVRSTTDDYYHRSADPDEWETAVRSAQAARTSATAEVHASATESPQTDAREAGSPQTDAPGPVIPAPTPKESPAMEYTSREDKASRVTELRSELFRLAVEYPGVLPTEAQERWDSMVGEQDTLERDIAAWDTRQARIAAYAENPGKVEQVGQPAPFNVIVRKSEADVFDLGGPESMGSPERRSMAFRDNAMRAVEMRSYPHPAVKQDEARGHIAHLLDTIDTPDKKLARRILVTGSKVYENGFKNVLLGRPLSHEESLRTAMAVQVDATGGYAVPFWFDPTLVKIGAWTAVNPYRAACRTINIVGTDTYHGVTVAAATATRVGPEITAVTEGAPATGQISAIVGKVHALVSASVEFLEDRPDFVSEVALLFAEAKDTEEESSFSLGIGDALGQGFNPVGMFAAHGTVGAFTPVHTTTDKTTAIADVWKTEVQLPLRYRPNAAWFISRAGIRFFQNLETVGGVLFNSTGGYPAVGVASVGNTGNTGLKMIGYPVWEVPSAPWLPTTDDTPQAVLCDPSRYYIVERIGMQVEIIPHMFADAAGSLPTGQRGIYAWWRNTAKPANVDAGRVMTVE